MILLLRTYKSSPYLSPYLSVYIFAIFPSLLLSPDLFIRQSRKQRRKTHTLTLWKHDPIPLRVCHFNHLLISFPSITPSSILLSCANTGIKTIHSPTRNNIPLMNIFHVLTLTLLLFFFLPFTSLSFFPTHVLSFSLNTFICFFLSIHLSSFTFLSAKIRDERPCKTSFQGNLPLMNIYLFIPLSIALFINNFFIYQSVWKQTSIYEYLLCFFSWFL